MRVRIKASQFPKPVDFLFELFSPRPTPFVLKKSFLDTNAVLR